MEAKRLIITCDPIVKREARNLAKSLGISLNSLLNNELNRFVAERDAHFIERLDSITAPDRSEIFRVRVKQADARMIRNQSMRAGIPFHMYLTSIFHQAATKPVSDVLH